MLGLLTASGLGCMGVSEFCVEAADCESLATVNAFLDASGGLIEHRRSPCRRGFGDEVRYRTA